MKDDDSSPLRQMADQYNMLRNETPEERQARELAMMQQYEALRRALSGTACCPVCEGRGRIRVTEGKE